MIETKRIMIVGLNNPQDKYERTRHNIGFEAIHHISEKYIAKWFIDGSAFVKVVHCEAHTLIFVKPLSGMNNSGIPVAALAKQYEVKTENIIVFHDDIDLVSGKIKVKSSGGSGGHNGLKSLDKHIGTDYVRVRIGVGRPIDKTPILDYVLGDFTQDDVVWISDKLEKISVNYRLLFEGKFDKFMKNCI